MFVRKCKSGPASTSPLPFNGRLLSTAAGIMVSCLAEERFYFKRRAGSGSSLSKCTSGLLFVLKCGRSTDVRTWSGCVWLILSLKQCFYPHSTACAANWTFLKPPSWKAKFAQERTVFRSMLLRMQSCVFLTFVKNWINKHSFSEGKTFTAAAPKGKLWRARQHRVAKPSYAIMCLNLFLLTQRVHNNYLHSYGDLYSLRRRRLFVSGNVELYMCPKSHTSVLNTSISSA